MFAEFIKSSGERQTVWARRIGVSQSYLSSLISGRKEPSLRIAARIERLSNGAVPAASWVPDEAAPVPGQTEGAGA